MRSGSSLFALACLAACATPLAPERAADRAAQAGFERLALRAGGFDLISYRRFAENAVTLRLYIENDGAAWPRPDVPPADPTPPDPLVLRLALLDGGPAVAWISRPCQYLSLEWDGTRERMCF